MCGITGALSFRSSTFAITEPFVTRMRDTMVHRGPDGARTWVAPDGRVGLGHRRLAIIDLSEAALQPMANDDGSVQLVFNGEIYNHADIRAELEKLGRYRWQTDHSDTEVILRAFEEWGIDCVHRFRGMFAFALWDARRRELWLVRDRIGIKPLYYSVHDGRITFASEIKALLEDPDQRRAVDEESVYHHLSFLSTPAPRTMFAGIRKLPGGTWLRVSEDGRTEERRYWDVFDEVKPLEGVPDAEIAERLLAELRVAVALRKVSDVPVGVFLSGGIDSSTNARLFSEGESRKVQTFTVGYRGEFDSAPSELPYARLMADQVGAEHHECILTLDHLLDFLPQMVRLQDEPLADPVCVPLYYVSKTARDAGVIVCQVGEGSDELFWGYNEWRRSLRLQQWSDATPVPSVVKRLGLGAVGAAGFDTSFRYEWLRRSAEGLPLFWGGIEAFTETHKRALVSPRLRKSLGNLSSWDALAPIHRRFEESAWEKTPLHWMSYLDLNFRLPELLLMRVDKMSMGASIEARVPFLDHKFVGLAMSVPQDVKTRDGVLKAILKRAVRGHIPDQLIDRRKQGFSVPIQEWFRERLGVRVRDELRRFCADSDLLDHAQVAKILDRGKFWQPWYLLNLALWWREFIGGK